MNAKLMHMASWILLIVGGLNWLLVGLFGWDISAGLGGMDAPLVRVIYVLVGVSALYELMVHKANCKVCGNQ